MAICQCQRDGCIALGLVNLPEDHTLKRPRKPASRLVIRVTATDFTSDATLMLQLLQEYSAARDGALLELFGPTYRPKQVRDELMRRVALSALAGEHRHLSDYQRELKLFGSSTTVARMADSLVHQRLIALVADPEDARALIVEPLPRLAAFYNNSATGLIRVARQSFGPEPQA